MLALSPNRCRSRSLIAGVSMLALATSGCVGGTGSMFGDSVDPNDACGAERAAFSASDDFFGRAIAEGVLVGAAGGALLGFLTTGDAGGAARGAIAGAVAGGVGGYWAAQQKADQDRAAMSRAIYEDIDAEGKEIDRAVVTFVALKRCRFDVASSAKAQYRAGQITREEAQRRLEDQRARFGQELQVAQQLGIKMRERGDEMQFASQELIKEDPNRVQFVNQWVAANPPQVVAPAAPALPAAPIGTEVVTQGANIRQAPSTSAPILTSLAAGTAVTLLGQQGDWKQIRLADGREGYIFQSLSAPQGSAAAQQAQRPRPARQAPPLVQAAAPPANADEATKAAIVSQTNLVKRQSYDNLVAQSQAEAQVAFDIDALETARLHGHDAPVQRAALEGWQGILLLAVPGIATKAA